MSDPLTVDLLVLGGGPGGYAAAFRAADMGLSVALVDKEANPGGVCLYRGCIPSKAYLHVAKLLEETNEAAAWGVTYQKPEIDLEKLRAYKNGVVKKLTGGLGSLSKARKVHYVRGTGTFTSSTTLTADTAEGAQDITFKKAIVATGSSPLKLPHLTLDTDRVMDSTDALELPDIPESLLLIGGGVIGMEIGMVYNALGSTVSVVEMLPQVLTGADPDIAKPLVKKIKKQFEDVLLNTKVTALEDLGDSIKVSLELPDGTTDEKTYSRVLVAIGRRPNSAGIGLENTKVTVSDRGFVETNTLLETSDPAIYAIGDVIGNPMLAHKASHEAHVAVNNIAGKRDEFQPYCIPSVVYTNPELAWAGLTELEAKEKGVNYKVATFPWAASGRAVATDSVDGMTKLIFDPETDRLLGMGLVGTGAGDLISEGALAIEMGATASDIGNTIHPHPTVSETIMEAAELYSGHCDHFIAPKKRK